MSPLKDAIFQSDMPTVISLIKEGTAWDLDGFMTAQTIENALKSDEFELVDLLIEKEIISLDIFEYDSWNHTIFKLLLKLPLTDNLQEYIQRMIGEVENIDEEIEGETWLGLAIQNKASLELIEIIVEGGCPIDVIDKYERTYLFKTVDLELTQYLIDQGIDLNKQDIEGKNAFWNVIKSKNTELIQLYLDQGIDVNAQNKKGETIYNVVCFEVMDVEIFNQLSQYDPPRFDLKDKENQSLFMKQVCKPAFGNTSTFIQLMLDNGADLFQEEQDAYANPTTAADQLMKQSYEVFEMLNTGGHIDVSVLDNKGNTWLHKVCMEELNFEESKAKVLYKKVKLLLKLGADPSLKNDEDKSPIDYAQDDNLKSKALSLLLKSQNN